MTDHHHPAVSPDDVAAFAVDAHPTEHTAAIASHLAADSGSRRLEHELRRAAGEFAAAVVMEVAPAGQLRARLMGEAVRRRPPAVVVAGASPRDVHRCEASRLLLLLQDLTADDWHRSMDPPELAGWTVHDAVVHVLANESLLAATLGVTVPGVSETALDNEGRTAQARRRHAEHRPARAVGELQVTAAAVDDALLRLGESRLHEIVEWWGRPISALSAALIRGFEIWIHTDDIRRAVGEQMVPPPPASLLALAHTCVALVPRMMETRGEHRPDTVVRFRFSDLDDAGWDVDLGVGGLRPAGEHHVEAEIVSDAVEMCRVVGARVPPGSFAYDVHGDDRLAADVVASLPALAVL